MSSAFDELNPDKQKKSQKYLVAEHALTYRRGTSHPLDCWPVEVWDPEFLVQPSVQACKALDQA